jgi:hypothetical protein
VALQRLKLKSAPPSNGKVSNYSKVYSRLLGSCAHLPSVILLLRQDETCVCAAKLRPSFQFFEGISPRTLLFCSSAECPSPAAAASHRRRQRPSVQMKLVIFTLPFCSFADCSSPAAAASRACDQSYVLRPHFAEGKSLRVPPFLCALEAGNINSFPLLNCRVLFS